MSNQELKSYQQEQHQKQLDLNKQAAQKILESLIASLKTSAPFVQTERVVRC